MNENELFMAIGETDESMLDETEENPKMQNNWIKWVSAAAAVCVIGAGAVGINSLVNTPSVDGESTITTAGAGNTDKEDATASAGDVVATGNYKYYGLQPLSLAVSPEMPTYPDEMSADFETQYDNWSAFIKNQKAISSDYDESLKNFTNKANAVFLSESEGENMLYSPVNLYISLSMLAETADNNSRQQILELLDVKDIETLREYNEKLWYKNYSNDGAVTSIFSNSIWLNDSLGYNMDTIDTLSDSYYADSFSGNVSDENYTKALQVWLNEKTGGMLENEAQNIEMKTETVFSMASTVYFRGKWQNRFNEEKNEEGVFTTSLGEKVSCEFMNRYALAPYYWSDSFGAVSLDFASGGLQEIWLILPDEGITPEEILKSGEIERFFSVKNEQHKFINVNLSVPKFDTVYNADLVNGLNQLGVTDVFDNNKADFSPLLNADSSGTALSQAQHSVRVAIDEEGCTAAAFTVMSLAGAAMPPDEEIDFILDRPFIFIIKGVTGDDIFIGVINDPTKK